MNTEQLSNNAEQILNEPIPELSAGVPEAKPEQSLLGKKRAEPDGNTELFNIYKEKYLTLKADPNKINEKNYKFYGDALDKICPNHMSDTFDFMDITEVQDEIQSYICHQLKQNLENYTMIKKIFTVICPKLSPYDITIDAYRILAEIGLEPKLWEDWKHEKAEAVKDADLQLKKEKKDIENAKKKKEEKDKENAIYDAIKESIEIKKNQKAVEKFGDETKFYKDGHQVDTTALGIVIYMTSSMYSEDPEKNKEIHMPHEKNIIGEAVLKWLNCCGLERNIINELIIGHEHGFKDKKNKSDEDKSFKCHMQIFVNLKYRIRIQIYPAEFNIQGQNYICRAQPGKKIAALRNYCIEEHDYIYYNNNIFKTELIMDMVKLSWRLKDHIMDKSAALECIKELGQKKLNVKLNSVTNLKSAEEINEAIEEEKKKPNAYKWLCENLNFINSIDDVKKLLQSEEVKTGQLFRDIALYGIQKIWANIQELKKEPIPPAIWNFPDDIRQEAEMYDYNDPETRNSWPVDLYYKRFCRSIIYGWFQRECLNTDLKKEGVANRRKALMMYGKRGLGKTCLFGGLLTDITQKNIGACPYIIYCRSTISWSAFKNKLNTAELIILDDVDWNENQNEMIKSLCAGQECTFRSLYIDNIDINLKLPVVILTNKLWKFNSMLNNDEWKDDLDFIALNDDDYLGPPNTKPERKSRKCIPPAIQAQLEEMNEKRKRKSKDKNNAIKALAKFITN